MRTVSDEGGSSSDEDDDVYMRTAPPHFSQFTQTLMLFVRALF
jgi:hypothetical protein